MIIFTNFTLTKNPSTKFKNKNVIIKLNYKMILEYCKHCLSIVVLSYLTCEILKLY